MKKTITVFTPTYNRAGTLPALYQSLADQTDKDFVWLVVDDGSRDDTSRLIGGFIKEGKIEIRLYRQENGGKHRAHNYGVLMCDTEWFICVDSDDCLSRDAIEVFKREIGLVEEEIGVLFAKYEVHSGFPRNWFRNGERVHVFDMYTKLGRMVETALLYRTAFLRSCMFPEFEGEKYLGEEIIYNELDKTGLMRASDARVYFYEYLEDGLTKNAFRLWKSNPAGMLALLQSRYSRIIASDAGPLRKCVLIFKCIMNINALCFAAGRRIADFSPNRFLSAMLFIPSKVFAHYRYGGGNG